MNKHEAGFVHSFIKKAKQVRYSELLTHPKRRKGILDRLNSAIDLDLKYAISLPPNMGFTDKIIALMKEMKSPDIVYTIADCSELDQRDLPLQEAANLLCSHEFAVIVSCIPGQLAFYKAESPAGVLVFTRISSRPTK